MGYVDMRDRRGEGDRTAVGATSSGHKDGDVNGLLVAGILVLGVSLTVLLGLGPMVLLCLCAIGIAYLTQEHGLIRPQNPRKVHGLGSEKQLLLALRESGGLTAVEAALETSLTVDEADDILSRLAERGHLRVEGRDGALSYALPGRHSAGVTGPFRGPEGRTP